MIRTKECSNSLKCLLLILFGCKLQSYTRGVVSFYNTAVKRCSQYTQTFRPKQSSGMYDFD